MPHADYISKWISCQLDCLTLGLAAIQINHNCAERKVINAGQQKGCAAKIPLSWRPTSYESKNRPSHVDRNYDAETLS